MGWLESYKVCMFQKIFKFSGRGSRAEFWKFFIMHQIICQCIFKINSMTPEINLVILSQILSTVGIIAFFSAGSRRLHDINQNAKQLFYFYGLIFTFILIDFIITKILYNNFNEFMDAWGSLVIIQFAIILVFLIFLILLLIRKGDSEVNKYGEPPIKNKVDKTINEKWFTDVTEFNLRGEKLYLSPILDAHGRYIVSYNISKSPNFYQIIDMLDKAFLKNKELSNLIIHSDQGWQYQHKFYTNKLKEKNIIQSMSRKGNSLDNGLMESFFGILKSEMFYGQENKYRSIEDLKNAIDKYIDYYNNKRIKVKLKGLTPSAYRNQSIN